MGQISMQPNLDPCTRLLLALKRSSSKQGAVLAVQRMALITQTTKGWGKE